MSERPEKMSDREEAGPQAEWIGPEPRGWAKALRTGLVLSGGGLRFAVHAGLYNHMERTGYQENAQELLSEAETAPALSTLFDCMVGTSAGSLVATAIACGYCAEDITRFSLLMGQPDFHTFVLDPNWLGAGSFLLQGDAGYLKGLFQGEAIRRTLQVFFSHNFLRRLGALYADFAKRRLSPDGPEFAADLGKLTRELRSLPVERLPQMVEATGQASDPARNTDPVRTLHFITFQDINPGVRVPHERMRSEGRSPHAARAEAAQIYASYVDHTRAYRESLAEYYAGRAAAGRSSPPDPETERPMLLVVGTDLVTGQKTVFGNYNLFEKELVYGKEKLTPTDKGIAYRYINPQGHLDVLPSTLTEELRPANYLYKYLSDGLPVAWAVRASLSIPGVFAPALIRYQDQAGPERTDYFIDGGVTDNYALQLAADPLIGRCERILGGNIGNLGRRVHNYGVRNIVEILLQTLLVQGDANVDANVENELVQRAAVTTINELTTTDVADIRDLVKIGRLITEGEGLAEQFFRTFRAGDGPVKLNRLFGPPGSFVVFLPRIEAYKPLTNASEPPPDPCADLPTGASEIDRLVRLEIAPPALSQELRQNRATELGRCEARITPPPLLGPGGLLPGPTGHVVKYSGQQGQSLPMLDPINLARQVVLIVLLCVITLVGLGVWRGVGWLLQESGVRPGLIARFDSLSFWGVLATVGLGGLWQYLLFFRAMVYDFWVARSARLPRRTLEVPVGLALYALPMLLYQALGELAEPWQTLLALVLIALSTGALVFSTYAVITFGITLRKTIRENFGPASKLIITGETRKPIKLERK